jgi:hypothetical protein
VLKPAGLRVADAHQMLLNSDSFAEAFKGLDCAVAARVVEQLTGHLCTVTQIAAAAVID